MSSRNYLADLNREFGEYLDELCEGKPSRVLWRETGVNHTTIAEARGGMVPGYKTLERLADGLSVTPRQRYELFRRAGYTMNEGTPLERVAEYLQELQRRYGRTVELNPDKGLGNLTHEDVDSLIEASNEIIQQEGWSRIDQMDEPVMTKSGEETA